MISVENRSRQYKVGTRRAEIKGECHFGRDPPFLFSDKLFWNHLGGGGSSHVGYPAHNSVTLLEKGNLPCDLLQGNLTVGLPFTSRVTHM